MSVVVALIIAIVVWLVIRGNQWRRVDAPVNPPGKAIIRRRWNVWMVQGRTWLYYIAFGVFGWVIGHNWPH